ncbi:uncharacterized protein LOC143300593 [Babylonia areolata]|uniref:uncharacterized protein LOC143300593 n=1 Tax=Babylonia areolata TaxID=304850 RepID=UPI003FD41999
MDCLEQARTLYGEYHRQGNSLSQEKRASIYTAITKLIRTSLLQQGGNASFRHHPFPRLIQRTVGANRFHGDRASSAFLTLEKYLVLLAQQPWKREFWVLKLYGGYFCTKVRAHLEGAEEVLQLIGFMPDEGDAVCQRLVLQEAPDTQRALDVAFDCQVASLECQYIGDYHAKMRCVGLDLSEAANMLLCGAPSELLVGSSLPGELGRSGGALGNVKVSYSPSSMQPDLFPASRGHQGSAVKSHTVLASGGMGMGVVTGIKSMHQVIGVQPSHHASSSAGGGTTTHQVIGVSATHRVTGAGPFQTTTIAAASSSGVTSTESLGSSSPAVGMMRGVAGATPGAGHSVLRVTGVPAAQPPDPACSRRTYSTTPLQPLPAQAPTPVPAPAPAPSSLPSHAEPLYVSHPVDAHRPQTEGLTALLPHYPPPLTGESGRLSFMASHSPSVAYQSPGSRASYASSGYGSGSASVLSGGSSAYVGSSSGYCSATSSSSSPSHDYANLPLRHPPNSVVVVDQPPAPAPPPPSSRLSRHSSQKPQFSSIQEDEPGGVAAPFPEATHEEHLRESLKNLQVAHPDKAQKRALLSKNLSPQLAGQGDPVLPVTYDDWRWFPRGEAAAVASKGVLSSTCRMGGEGSKGHPLSGGNGQPAATLRSTSSFPVLAMTSADPAASSQHSRHPSAPSDLHHHHHHPPRTHSQGYVSWTAAAGGPSSSSVLARPTTLASTTPSVSSSPTVPQDVWRATVTPNPVYYPPPTVCEKVSLNGSAVVKTPHYANPTLSQKLGSGGRWEERGGPLSHRSRGSSPPSPSPIYNNLERTPPAGPLKVLNAPLDSDRGLMDAGNRDVSMAKGSGVGALGGGALYANLVDMSGGGTPYRLDRGQWTCQACTMENWEGDGECRACGRVWRGAQEGEEEGEALLFSSVAGESRRVCPSCTFENPPGCRSCEVCEALLPQDVHTYV